jgi:hypothetical protein
MFVLSAITTHMGQRGHQYDAGHLIDLIPEDVRATMTFVDFARITEERPILPGDSSALLRMQIDVDDDDHVRCATELRRFLKDCSIEVRYTDVYRTLFAPYDAHCGWFGRSLDDEP